MLYENEFGQFSEVISTVLILILMEYALWGTNYSINVLYENSLNPYSNGICSMRFVKFNIQDHALQS